MKNQTDPVVQDLNSWINRNAGQHQRRVSEGAESAARLLRLPVVDAMTDDRLNLHRVDARQLGDCCNHECNEKKMSSPTLIQRVLKFLSSLA